MKRHRLTPPPFASWLPTLAAPALILVAGIFAYAQDIRLAEATARLDAIGRIEEARPALERTLQEHLSGVRDFAAALEAAPPASDADFAAMAARFTADIPGLVAAVAETADGATGIHPADATQAVRALAALGPLAARPGLGMLDLDGAPALMLSAPFATNVDGFPATARLTLVVNGASLLPDLETAPGAPPAGLTLLPAPDTRTRGIRNPPARATMVEIRMPEGGIALGATQVSGWRDVPPNGWIIPLLTLLSAALVVGPMVRTRQLAIERRRNLTELDRRKTELDLLSQRHGLALEASKVGVWDYDIGRDALVWDGRMDEIYGYVGRPGPRLYQDWANRIHPEDLARAKREFADAIESFSRYDSKFRVVLEDGTLRHVEARGAVYSAPETGTRIVGVNWDVSEQTRLTTELIARQQEAETASQAKSQFLATMSHEIRTPMNGILGMLDLLLHSELNAEQRERLQIAYGSAEHLLTILNDILEFSKLEADRIELQRLDVDVRSVVRETVALMSAAAQAQAVSLEMDLDPALPASLVADPTRLRQVLLNLVGNAVKFTEDGAITVSARYEPGAAIVTFAVRDSGIGIPDNAVESLFQRFAQVNSSDTRARGGTGLGLAICKQLVELMGGGISVRSVEGVGSTFTFWFPALPGLQTASATPHAVKAPARPASNPLRILVAEDNATNQHVLKAYLDRAGHRVDMTGNGRDCVDRAATGGYDVILMDIQMPTMDGVDATLLIRAMTGPASKTPIIALTANASSTERERYIAAGMDAHVSKPVSIDALTAAIASVTDTAPPCGSATSLRAVPSPRASRSVTPRPGRTTIPPQATIPRPDQRP